MKRIGFIVFPGFQILDMVAISVFELANLALEQAAYTIEVLSEHGGPVMSSAGVRVETAAFTDAEPGPSFDTVLVAGSMGVESQSDGLHAFLNRALLESRRTASICTGAFILAEAGILDGRRATTHWYYARDLQRRFPNTKIEEDRIFIVDGPVWTSAGMTSCIDLCLAMVEQDLGVEMSRGVAKKMVVYHRRSGGQSQYSALLELSPKSDRIQSSLVYAKENLRQALTVEELAAVAHLSPRQFSRAFTEETGQSPAKAIENLRVEAARNMLEDGRHTIDMVAAETGFGDPERMRRAFLRAFGQPPQSIKRAAKSLAA
ncbi:GlxA family transcriptional regulator [Undibacterium terreum]|uniref:AraC family transcriptional regulator n=1 Tax=Undibacterium terreum TaxID=1224302 RepID=A0A916UEC4_9BURK|nr:GlxA family transcriptional regulator [Undibacterium terreum]GGC69226.1 AraC family transcriptional regulator [Undibacterium terreum]